MPSKRLAQAPGRLGWHSLRLEVLVSERQETPGRGVPRGGLGSVWGSGRRAGLGAERWDSSALRPRSQRSMEDERSPRPHVGASRLRGEGTRSEGLPEGRGGSERRARAKCGCCIRVAWGWRRVRWAPQVAGLARPWGDIWNRTAAHAHPGSTGARRTMCT